MTEPITIAVIALVGVVIGGVMTGLASWLAARSQARSSEQLAARRSREEARSGVQGRVSSYLAATYQGVLSLRDMALAETEAKPAIEKAEVWPTVDRVNAALVAIRVCDSGALVAAVNTFDVAMVQLAADARNEVFTHDTWRARRTEVIGTQYDRVVSAARDDIERLNTAT